MGYTQLQWRKKQSGTWHKSNKTIGDGSITVDFWIIKDHQIMKDLEIEFQFENTIGSQIIRLEMNIQILFINCTKMTKIGAH